MRRDRDPAGGRSMTVVTTEQTPCSADSPTARRPPSTRCRKHAFARFSSNVGLGTQVRGYSPRSRHVSYDLHRSLSVDCSVGRYYDPATGQFLSVDPLVEETGEPYTYAEDDPISELDPSGNASWQSAGKNPPSCNNENTVIYANFTWQTIQGRTGRATLYCGTPQGYGLRYLLKHDQEFKEAFRQYGADWYWFMYFINQTLSRWPGGQGKGYRYPMLSKDIFVN